MAHLIIDGYNLLPVSPYATRDLLIQALVEYRKVIHHTIIVFFDGTHEGTGSGSVNHFGSIEVVFTPLHQTADDHIIAWLERHQGKIDGIVISSDRKIQRAARNRHFTFVDSEMFARKLAAAAVGPDEHNKAFEDPHISDDRERASLRASKPNKGPARKLSKLERKRRQKLKHL